MKRGLPLPPHLVAAAEEFVRQRTGLVFRGARRPALEAGLAAAMRRAALTDPRTYLQRVESRPELLDDLVGEITVGESYFFRDAAQFAVIREEIIPALVSDRARNHPLRIWSAGCATGEEPYSLAMLVRELGLADQTHIVATDLSRAALAGASHGRYTRWSLRGLAAEVVQAYFVERGNRFELSPSVRAAVDFRYLNLADDTYPSLSTGVWAMDLIVCRNVLIYFDAETIARVARRLIDSLSQDGWLLLGASDPLLSDLVPCDVHVTRSGLVYRRATTGRSTRESIAAPTPVEEITPPPAAAPLIARVDTVEPVSPAVDDSEAAIRCYETRDFPGAVEHAERAVRRDGSDATPWIVLVRAHANRGDLAAAGRACAAALERHPSAAELHYLHAVLLSEAERAADAAAAARRALYLDRAFVVAHLVLGGALGRLRDMESARRAFRSAEQLLAALAPNAIVPGSDGETAGRLLEMARVQMRLLAEAAA